MLRQQRGNGAGVGVSSQMGPNEATYGIQRQISTATSDAKRQDRRRVAAIAGENSRRRNPAAQFWLFVRSIDERYVRLITHAVLSMECNHPTLGARQPLGLTEQHCTPSSGGCQRGSDTRGSDTFPPKASDSRQSATGRIRMGKIRPGFLPQSFGGPCFVALLPKPGDRGLRRQLSSRLMSAGRSAR
jgi:hypothetical protein